MTSSTHFCVKLLALAKACEQLGADIELIRPVTYEKDPPIEKVNELILGVSALYDLRFDALFKAYEASIREHGFCHYDIEESIMQWWGAVEDLRCASEGATLALLSKDGFDNILLGIASTSLVRAARFERVLKQCLSAALPDDAQGSI